MEIRKSSEVELRVCSSTSAVKLEKNDIAPSLESDEKLGDRMVLDFDQCVVREAERDEELWVGELIIDFSCQSDQR